MNAPLMFLALAISSTALLADQVFVARVESVRIDALVTEGGRIVTGLTADDFEILDNGVPQKVETLLFGNVALDIALALDTSGSVSGERLAHLRAAAGDILDALHADDGMAVLTFGRDVTLRTALTKDRARAREALGGPAEGGSTALIDATLGAIVAAEAAGGRSLAMIFSDGTDTASFLRSDSVVDTARRSEAVVYAVAARGTDRMGFLRDVTRASGGRVLEVDATRDLTPTFLAILNEFRQRYVMSFTPHGVPQGGWHRLEIRVKNRRAQVTARQGYLADRR